MKIENSEILVISQDFYNQLHKRNTDEETHTNAMRGASVRHVNALAIDEVIEVQHEITKQDSTKETIAASYLVWQYEAPHQDRGGSGPHDRASFLLVRGTGTAWLEKINAAIAGDAALHHTGSEQGSTPAVLGYAFAKSNAGITSLSVSDIDDFSQIEFRIRAGRNPEAALGILKPFSVRVDVSSIPVNANPVSGLRLTLAVPGADDIVVSRSTDGTILYLLGQDNAAAFGIEIFGHSS